MKKSILLFCFVWPVVVLSQNEIPQDSLTPTYLNEILLRAFKLENPSFSTVSNNYNEKIVQPKNIAGMFEDITGFSLIKRGNYAMDPTFRGAQYEQLNIQYDGGIKAMHACPNRMDPITSHIAPEEIEKIEIIKGPYSVRYGSSFGGVVNIVTRNPREGKHGLHGSVASGYETNGSSYVGMAQLQYVNEKIDLSGSYGYRDYGNYKDGSGSEIPSAFRNIDYGLKFGYNFSPGQRLQASWRQSFGRDVLHAGLPMDTEYDDSSIASLDYVWKNINQSIQQFQIKAYYSYVDHLMVNYNRPNSKMMEMASHVESGTAGIKAELEWQTSERLKFYSGLDFLHIGRDGERTGLIKMENGTPLPEPVETKSSVWQDSYIDDIGVYTQAQWRFKDTYMLSAGLRYDRIFSDIRKPEPEFSALYPLKNRTENNFSGTVSLKKSVGNSIFLELAYGRGVRSANMIERYINRFNVGQDSYSYTGNPNLKAEVNNQLEAGINGYKNFDSWIQTLHFEASVYYSFMKNYISAVIDPALGPEAKRFINLDRAYKTGFDAGIKLDLIENLFLQGSASYVYARNKDFDESIPLTPPWTTRVTAGFENEKFWANIQFNSIASQNKIAPSFGEVKTPGYQTVDIRAGVRLLDQLSVGLSGLNIFDKTYHDHLNFAFRNQEGFLPVPINEPGRNFTAFIQYEF